MGPRARLLVVAAAMAAVSDAGGARLGPEPRAVQAALYDAPPATTTTSHSTTGLPGPGQRVAGLLTFRGNATRNFYGTGPVPTTEPRVRWTFPDRPMCRVSTSGTETKEWCGLGWTGQPAVFEREERTWVVFGAYDGAIHFVDAETGTRMLPAFQTGDIVKGSVTIDPDGYPLVYSGSRDDHFRVIAFDGERPVELWRLSAEDAGPSIWNNDWDGSAWVEDDLLYEGGENGRLHIVRLNRAYGADGRVTVDPELVFQAPGWDDELLRSLGDRNVSIESSVMKVGDTLWFTNSGGLVQAWDVRDVRSGRTPTRVFRFWVGDDTDATLVADPDGDVYVSAEYERRNARSRAVGQLVRLDVTRPDPVVWSFTERQSRTSGIWATPALHGGRLYTATHGGRLLALDRATGDVAWAKPLPGPLWQSPVVVGDVLLQGDCGGELHAFDVSENALSSAAPVELWSMAVGGCLEATAAVWKGRIYLGSRDGYIRGIW